MVCIEGWKTEFEVCQRVFLNSYVEIGTVVSRSAF